MKKKITALVMAAAMCLSYLLNGEIAFQGFADAHAETITAATAATLPRTATPSAYASLFSTRRSTLRPRASRTL